MFLWIKKYVLSSKILFGTTVILLLLESLALISTISLQQLIIDRVFVNKEYDILNNIISLFIVAFLSYSALFTLVPYFMFKNTDSIRKNLVSDLLDVIYSTPMSKIKENSRADYVYHFTNDIGKVSYILSDMLPRGFQQIITVIIIGGVLGYHSLILLSVVVFLSIIYIYLGKKFGPKKTKLNLEVQKNKSKILNVIEENLVGTKEIVSYNRNQWALQRFFNIFNSYIKLIKKEIKIENQHILISEPIKWGGTLIAIFIGGYLVLNDQMTIGAFVVVVQFSTMLMESLQRTFNFFMDFSKESSSIQRLREVIINEDKIRNTQESLEIDNFSIESIRFEDVSFGYDSLLFRNLNLEIPINKKVAIIGSSGSGKSTLIKLLTKFESVTSGKILINEKSLKHISSKELSKKISIVTQNPYFFNDSIKNNLIFGREEISEQKLIEACKLANIYEDIKNMSLSFDEVITERASNLSGGQKQRLAIARALLTDPDVLIFDESTSALDLKTEREVQKNIDLLRGNKSTIFITHRLSTIKNSDIIFVFDKGKLIARGNHDLLIQESDFYNNLILSDSIT